MLMAILIVLIFLINPLVGLCMGCLVLMVKMMIGKNNNENTANENSVDVVYCDKGSELGTKLPDFDEYQTRK